MPHHYGWKIVHKRHMHFKLINVRTRREYKSPRYPWSQTVLEQRTEMLAEKSTQKKRSGFEKKRSAQSKPAQNEVKVGKAKLGSLTKPSGSPNRWYLFYFIYYIRVKNYPLTNTMSIHFHFEVIWRKKYFSYVRILIFIKYSSSLYFSH